MSERIITDQHLLDFKNHLINEERSVYTIEKYLRDVHSFMNYMNESSVTKEMMMQYKKALLDSDYCYTSINSMLSSINSFLSFIGWDECKVKTLKIQRQIYSPESKELSKKEYEYLGELKDYKYKDSQQLYSDLYDWGITLHSANHDDENGTTKLKVLPRSCSYFHIDFELSGGTPYEAITMYSKTKFPGKNWNTSD